MSATRQHVRKSLSMRSAGGAAAAIVLAGVVGAACGTAAPHSAGSTSHSGKTGGHPSPSGGHTSSSGGHGTSTGLQGDNGNSATGRVTGTVTPPPPVAAQGVQDSVSDIPWSEVGQGWTLALWSSSTKSSRSLFVVDPEGGRYLVTSDLPAGTSIASLAGGGASALLSENTSNDQATILTDVSLQNGSVLHTFDMNGYGYTTVSGDGQRALYQTQLYDSTKMDDITEVSELDLESGATLAQFSAGTSSVSFTSPDGLALLENTQFVANSHSANLTRTSLTGSSELTFPSSFAGGFEYNGSFVESPDGSEIVMGSGEGLVVVSNDGSVIREIPSPYPSGVCSPMKWWSEGVVAAQCGVTGTAAIYLVPLSGAAATFVASGPQLIMGLWHAGGGYYGMGAACGVVWIDHLAGINDEPQLRVPGAVPGTSQYIVGSYGDDLEVQVTLSCDSSAAQQQNGTGTALEWFDPATDGTTLLLGPGVNGGMVDGAVQFGGGEES
jgi:hypothetical protein